MNLQSKKTPFNLFAIILLLVMALAISGCSEGSINDPFGAISDIFVSLGKWFSTTIPGQLLEGLGDGVNRVLASYLGGNPSDAGLANIVIPDSIGSLLGTYNGTIEVKLSKNGFLEGCSLPHPRMVRDSSFSRIWQLEPTFKKMLEDCSSVVFKGS